MDGSVSAEPPHAEVSSCDHQVLGAVVAGHAGGPVELGPVALAVVEGEGQRRRLRLPVGQGHAHRRVEAAGQDDQMTGHGQAPAPAVSSTEESVGLPQTEGGQGHARPR